MGNSQSAASKGPTTTAALPPPPSPFNVSSIPGPAGEDEMRSVIGRLINSLSKSTLGGSILSLPPGLLLLSAILCPDASDDLLPQIRILFSDSAFRKAFPGLARVRSDLFTLADLARFLGQSFPVTGDADYYVFAKVITMASPAELFETLLGICIKTAGHQQPLKKEELSIKLAIAEKLLAISRCYLNACEGESNEHYIRGFLNKFDFVRAAFVLLQNAGLFTDPIALERTGSITEFEESLVSGLVTSASNLYIQKRILDSHNLALAAVELLEKYSVDHSSLQRLKYILCKCSIWLGDAQAAVNLCEELINDNLEAISDALNEQPPNGILCRYQPTAQHLLYQLMLLSKDANARQLVVYFGRLSLRSEDSELETIIATTMFVDLLESRQWSEAYESIRQIPSADKRRDCVKRFLSVLCEHPDVAGDVLCGLPLVDSYSLVEEWLLLRARKSSGEAFRFLHNLLFLLYMSHGDYRGAAGAVYRLADRREGLERKRCLLLAVSCLELVHHDFQWIAMTKDAGTDPNKSGERQLFMLSLRDIRDELAEECHSCGMTIDDLLVAGHYDRAFRSCSSPEELKQFMRHFVSANDQRLLEYLKNTPLTSILLQEFIHCPWLMAHFKAVDVNGFLRMFNDEQVILDALDNHIHRWRIVKEKRKIGLSVAEEQYPRDLISSSHMTTPSLQAKYEVYLKAISSHC